MVCLWVKTNRKQSFTIKNWCFNGTFFRSSQWHDALFGQGRTESCILWKAIDRDIPKKDPTRYGEINQRKSQSRGKKVVLKSIHFLAFNFKIWNTNVQNSNRGFRGLVITHIRERLKNTRQKHPNQIPFTNLWCKIFKSFKSLGHLHSKQNPQVLLYTVQLAESHVSTDLVKLAAHLLTPFNGCKN